ncbi:MAG TPA: hypothetical protein PKG63_01120 [Bacteroidales bacterium]|nr:hypothetical protein [Bacteroidales bacterium]
MRKNLYLLLVVVALLCTFSCKKEEKILVNPNLNLSEETGYVFSDTAIASGVSFKIKIICNSNNGSNLTNLEVKQNNIIILNYGLNAPSLEKEVTLTKTNNEIDTIDIIIRNYDGLSAEKSLRITKTSSPYNDIIIVDNITIGAQNNTTIGSFLDVETGNVYTQDSAFNHQSLIDILYYYNSTELNCFSSAGGNIAGIYTGPTAPENWTTKNTTYFSRNTINITNDEFINCQNDSLIIAHIFFDGGRKAKSLQANQFWAFQTQSGKYGILKINAVSDENSGTINISYKIQK